MKRKALIVCKHLPYPVAAGGIERLLLGYEAHIFSDYDVYLLFYHECYPARLFHYGRPLTCNVTTEKLLAFDFAFALFFNYETDFQDDCLMRPFMAAVPSYCFLQSHPDKQVSDRFFRGVITHRSVLPHKNVLRLGGFYDPSIFFKRESTEELIISVGRIHEVKNQLDLVSNYRSPIYRRYGLPLYLVGGTLKPGYFQQVHAHVDNVSVCSTINPERPLDAAGWRAPGELAGLYRRARMFVMASPEESFCLALIEALACGVTCVINGNYQGFDGEELSPHVYGHTTEKRGSILDTLEEALARNIRIDASRWATRYSIPAVRGRVLSFIRERL